MSVSNFFILNDPKLSGLNYLIILCLTGCFYNVDDLGLASIEPSLFCCQLLSHEVAGGFNMSSLTCMAVGKPGALVSLHMSSHCPAGPRLFTWWFKFSTSNNKTASMYNILCLCHFY